MSFSRAGEKLSFRLHSLRNYFTDQEHIWDIGCDHALLGLSFLSEERVKEIHLVDPSEKVISSLTKKLLDSYITIPEKIHLHPTTGQNIKLTPFKNCIFIAGMGGKEIGEVMIHLLPQLDSSSRIILSPHKNILELRALLHSMRIALVKEEVVEEDGQFYQILVLSPHTEGEKVPLFGEEIWKGGPGGRYKEHILGVFKSHRDELSESLVKYLSKNQ